MADIEGEERNTSILTLWDQNRRRRLPLLFLSPDDALRSIFHPGRRKKEDQKEANPLKDGITVPFFFALKKNNHLSPSARLRFWLHSIEFFLSIDAVKSHSLAHEDRGRCPIS